jgi:hypothetical protein
MSAGDLPPRIRVRPQFWESEIRKGFCQRLAFFSKAMVALVGSVQMTNKLCPESTARTGLQSGQASGDSSPQ